MKHLPLVLSLILLSIPAWARPNFETLPPACSAATLLTTCVPQLEGVRARVTDATSTSLCINIGGGTTTTVCEFNGTAWAPTAAAGTFTGANGETITNTPDGTFLFSRDDAGTVTITAADDDATAALTILPGGAAAMILGGPTTLSVAIDTDGADLGIGSLNTSTVSLVNSVSGSIVLDLRDYADTTDDDAAHILLAANCTNTGSGVEECELQIEPTTAGAVFTLLTLDTDVNLGRVETATFGAPDQLFATPANLNQYIGVPKLNVTQSGAALPDGTATAEPWNPLIASCAPITAGTEAAGATFITGTASYEYTAQGTAADNDGFDCDVTGHAVNGTDSVGFWIKSDTALTAGTLDLTLDDGAVVEANANLPAISVLNEWQWIEVALGTDCDATCAGIDGIFIQVTAAGAATSEMDGTVITVDSGAFWISTAEVAIGDVQVGGVISVSSAAVAAATINTATELVEYTDYIVNYQTGADALVLLTDESANYGWTLEALNE